VSFAVFDPSPEAPFGARLRHAGLATAFDYWASLARHGTPAYRAFDPMAIAALLPDLQVIRRTADGDFRIDLSGESVAALIGANNAGRALSQIMAPPQFAERKALFGRALADALPVAYSSYLVIPGREHMRQKRLLLPFAENGSAADLLIAMIVGVPIAPHDRASPDAEEGPIEAIAAGPQDIPGRTFRG